MTQPNSLLINSRDLIECISSMQNALHSARSLLLTTDQESRILNYAELVAMLDRRGGRQRVARRSRDSLSRSHRLLGRLKVAANLLSFAQENRLLAANLANEADERLRVKKDDEETRNIVRTVTDRYSQGEDLYNLIIDTTFESYVQGLEEKETRLWSGLNQGITQVIRQQVAAYLFLVAATPLDRDLIIRVSDANAELDTTVKTLRDLEKRMKRRMADAKHDDVVEEARHLANIGVQTWLKYAPHARLLDFWARASRNRIKLSSQQVELSLKVANTVQAGLRAFALGSLCAILFVEGDANPLCQRWIEAADGLRFTSLSEIEYKRPDDDELPPRVADGQPARLTGTVLWSQSFQQTRDKRVTVLLVASSGRPRALVVFPFFNPRYIGIDIGSAVQFSGRFQANVLDEFTNRNTRRMVNQIRELAGTESGIVIDRFQIAGQADQDWGAFTANEIRHIYDVAPNRIVGMWSIIPGVERVLRAESWFVENRAPEPI